MKRVYIAGPITRGDLVYNVRQADEAFLLLVRAGFAPMNPMWSVYAGGIHTDGFGRVFALAEKSSSMPLDYSDWLMVDLAWVECAHAVLRLPGASSGADRETAHAKVLGIPVFDNIQSLVEALS